MGAAIRTYLLNDRAFMLAMLILAAAGAVLARSALGPFQDAVGRSLSLNDNQVALLQGPALALPLLLSAIPLGLLVDRYRRVWILMGALAAAALGTAATAWAPSFNSLFLARSVVGLAAPATAVVAASIIGDRFSPDQRGRANMLIALGQVTGIATAFAESAFYGTDGAHAVGWRPAMWHLSVVLGILASLCLLMPEPRRSEIVPSAAHSNSWAALWSMRSLILPLLAGASLVAIADGAALIWLSPLLLRQYGESASRAGPIVALVIFGGGLSGPLMGGVIADWTQRVGGARWTMKAAALLASLSAVTGLFPLVPVVAGSVALMLLFMAFGAGINVIVTALLTIILPNELRGRCLAALWALAAIFGLGLAPLTVSFLSTTFKPSMSLGHALSFVTVLTGLIGAAAFLLGARSGNES